MSSAIARSSRSIRSLARAITASRRASGATVSRATSGGRASERSSSFIRRMTSAAATFSVAVSWAAATRGATSSIRAVTTRAKRIRTSGRTWSRKVTGLPVRRQRSPLASDVRRVIPWAVSLKIVFNGKEYDRVDAMPPDVRKEYELALETLRKSGGEEILSLLQRDMGVSGTHIKATYREIVVNGKKYDSVDAMPPDVRRTYEQAMARVTPSGAAVRPPVTAPARAIRPPPMGDDADAGGRGGGLWRVLLWIGVGAAAAWWLLRRG